MSWPPPPDGEPIPLPADDPRLRFRLYISGSLVTEAWVDSSNPDADLHIELLQARQLRLTDAADRDGKRWLIEVYDPAQPEPFARLRFGTDPAGMGQPVQVETLPRFL